MTSDSDSRGSADADRFQCLIPETGLPPVILSTGVKGGELKHNHFLSQYYMQDKEAHIEIAICQLTVCQACEKKLGGR